MHFGYIFLSLFLLETCESKLVSLVVIHRHADRTPVVTFPKDPYSCHWKEGYGTLIQRGVERMRAFGKILRHIYGNFWPAKTDLEIQSSKVDRVIKSVEYLLEGVYSDDFLANPVPIHAKEFKDDHMLFPITTNCPAYDAELERVHQLPENVEWFNKLKPLWKYVEDNSGQHIELDVKDRLKIVNFQDTLLVERQHNLTLPEWVTESYYDQLAEAAVYQMKMIYSTKILQRLPAGLLFKELRKQMNAIKSGQFKKVRLYSTHDVKLAAMLMGLDAFNGLLPPYGTSIVFEFHSTGIMFKKRFVKAYYLNDTSTGTLHSLKLSDCNEVDGCPFEKFDKVIDDLIPIEWENDCRHK